MLMWWTVLQHMNLCVAVHITDCRANSTYHSLLQISLNLKRKSFSSHNTCCLIDNWPWLYYLENEIDCHLVDHWWFLNTKQKRNSSDWLNWFWQNQLLVWAFSAHTVVFLKIPVMQNQLRRWVSIKYWNSIRTVRVIFKKIASPTNRGQCEGPPFGAGILVFTSLED